MTDFDFMMPTDQEMLHLRARLFALRVAAANVEDAIGYEDYDNTRGVQDMKRQWTEMLNHWVEDARDLAYAPKEIC
jgi:hypothetical protein